MSVSDDTKLWYNISSRFLPYEMYARRVQPIGLVGFLHWNAVSLEKEATASAVHTCDITESRCL
jgi:hypothetical protein